MKAYFENASARSLLLIVFLTMIITALIPISLGINSLGEQIKLIEAFQSSNDNDEISNSITNGKHCVISSFGELIHSSLGITIPENESTWVSHTKEIRTGIFGACLLILALGLIFAVWLDKQVKKSIISLNQTVSRLAKNELNAPVAVYGPRNLQSMGSSLEKLRRRLLKNDHQLTQSLRHISHEIKTPLTSIKEGTQLLDEGFLGPINSEQREITDILKKSTQELQSSIENLLDYSSAVSAKQIKQREALNLSNLIDQVIDKHALTIKTKKLTLQKDSQPLNLVVNRKQMITVIDNLLSNAIKFSPEEGVIQIILSQNKHENMFTIIDQGPGVSDEQKRTIFDAFFVGDQAKHSTLKGTGLGLSIAKQLIEAHSGSLKLLNTHKGAAFRIILNR